jgi:hypothetical protein
MEAPRHTKSPKYLIVDFLLTHIKRTGAERPPSPGAKRRRLPMATILAGQVWQAKTAIGQLFLRKKHEQVKEQSFSAIPNIFNFRQLIPRAAQSRPAGAEQLFVLGVVLECRYTSFAFQVMKPSMCGGRTCRTTRQRASAPLC